jgi:hypothetical protein
LVTLVQRLKHRIMNASTSKTPATKTYHALQSWPKNFIEITAKYAGTCSETGLAYAIGTKIFYNPTTKSTLLARKFYKVDMSDVGYDHPAFKYAEARFEAWMENNLSFGDPLEYEEKYYGEDSIYDKAGAVVQALESCNEQLEDEGLSWAYFTNLDIDCSFEG